MLAPQVGRDAVRLRYTGLDGVTRACAIAFSLPPRALSFDRADFDVVIADRGQAAIYVEIGPDTSGDVGATRFRSNASQARRAMRRTRGRGASLECSGELFGVWLSKSRADLALLTTELATGPYPTPAFRGSRRRSGATASSRRSRCCGSILRSRAAYFRSSRAHQADAPSAFADAGTGKVLHETRKGEKWPYSAKCRSRAISAGVDQTPLFVILAGAYAQRTGDIALIDRLWPSLNAAMSWVESASIGGLLTYRRGAATGLANQGWKDSADSVFHADGSMAMSPIALVEVQGYVHAACNAMASLATGAAMRKPRGIGAGVRKTFAARSKRSSGWRIKRSTASRSTRSTRSAAFARRTRGIFFTRDCPLPSARRK
jgi:glycogen debranching enzyme